MAKRRKKQPAGWQQFDNAEDFLAALSERQSLADDDEDRKGGSMSGDGSGDSGATRLEDFVVDEKISAFVQSYKPCDEFADGAESFSDARLRQLLKAYVCPLGDPLKIYMEHLKLAGFRMTVSIATGELAMFAVRRFET